MNTKPILVSLGYNCEVSFRLEDYYGKLDSYLFSWSFEDSRSGFIKALENMEDVHYCRYEWYDGAEAAYLY